MKIEIDLMKKDKCDECGRNAMVYEFVFLNWYIHEPPPHLKLCRDCNDVLKELNK